MPATTTNTSISPSARSRDLLFAYRQNPLIWPDNWNIPESGNGIPDLLDEVKWELDWLLRMQNANGSVLSKMGVNAVPGRLAAQRRDRASLLRGGEHHAPRSAPPGTSPRPSALYQSVGMTAYANTLSNAAVAAYNWAVANPSVMFTNTGFASANPEVDTSLQLRLRTGTTCRIRAAVFLYELTGQAAYRTYVEVQLHLLIQGIVRVLVEFV